MNRNTLKVIAIIAMTLDHIGIYLITNPILYITLKMIGRITFPIMCYFICEGFKFTSNKKRYALRLFLFALISQIPWTLLNSNSLFTSNFFFDLNTIFSLLFGFLFLCILNSKINIAYKIILSLLLLIPLSVCDYNLITLLYIACFYYINKKALILVLPIIYTTSTILSIYINSSGLISPLNILINLGLLFTIPLFIKYNHCSKKKTLFNKYFFYIYYPSHLLIIFLIKLFFF